MRLLFLAPSPPRDAGGGSLRMYHMVRTLGRQFDLTLVAPALEGSQEAREQLGDCCRDTDFVPLRPSALRRWTRIGPYERDPALAEAIQRRLESNAYDAVQVEKPAMLVYLPPRLQIPIVLDLWAYGLTGPLRALRQERGLAARACNLLRLVRFGLFDRYGWPTLYGILVVSEVDRQRCLAARPGSHVCLVPNGVDCTAVRPASSPEAAKLHPPVLLFTGDLSFAPNIDAALLLGRSIFPRVRACHPEVQLHLVGRNPAPRIQALAGPDIKVIGEVREMGPYLREASVFVAPHFTGAGTRTKVLEAMAAGLPVVTTPIGIEGIDAQPGTHVLVADEVESLTAAITTLLQEAPARGRLATAGRRLVEARYDWPRCLAPLVELYASLDRGGRTR